MLDCLDDESKSRTRIIYVLFHDLFDDSCLARIVQSTGHSVNGAAHSVSWKTAKLTASECASLCLSIELYEGLTASWRN